jgi:hypothetical protein
MAATATGSSGTPVQLGGVAPGTGTCSAGFWHLETGEGYTVPAGVWRLTPGACSGVSERGPAETPPPPPPEGGSEVSGEGRRMFQRIGAGGSKALVRHDARVQGMGCKEIRRRETAHKRGDG